jgi:hypothetical protein
MTILGNMNVTTPQKCRTNLKSSYKVKCLKSQFYLILTGVCFSMDKLNLFFMAYFTLELMINEYANWLQVFIANGWNH